MVERFLNENDIIVSKTDLKGIIQYGNDIFCNISDYSVEEIIGKPHKILRHPDMPACVFRLLWQTISSGQEIFAYVKNLTKNGDFYWVFAHITPSIDESGKIVGYHSNRRKPSENALNVIKVLYQDLLVIETRSPTRAEGVENSMNHLNNLLEQKEMPYEKFVLGL